MRDSTTEYRVYSIVPREEAEPFWMWIGRAWPHKDQDGAFTIRLNALPITPKLVVRAYDPQEDQQGLPGMEAKAAAGKASAPAAKPEKSTAKA